MDRVGTSGKDMEKAIAFYQDIIGMEISLDTEFESHLADIIGSPGAKARIELLGIRQSLTKTYACFKIFNLQTKSLEDPKTRLVWAK